MSLTEQKRHQTMQNVLPEIQKMLPGYTPQDQQALVEQMDRTAFAASQGREEAYINKMAAKLNGVRRKLAKQSQGHQEQRAAPQSAAAPPGSAAGTRQDQRYTAAGEELGRQTFQYREQGLMPPSQGLPSAAQQYHRDLNVFSHQGSQQQWRAAPQPQLQRYMQTQSHPGHQPPHHLHPHAQQQQHLQVAQQQMRLQNLHNQHIRHAQRPHGMPVRPPGGSLAQQWRPAPAMQQRHFPRGTAESQPGQPAEVHALQDPLDDPSADYDSVLPASPSMQQMVMGLILHKDHDHAPQQPQPAAAPAAPAQQTLWAGRQMPAAHAQPAAGSDGLRNVGLTDRRAHAYGAATNAVGGMVQHAQGAGARPSQPRADPAQQWAQQPQSSQSLSFMELLTADVAPGPQTADGSWKQPPQGGIAQPTRVSDPSQAPVQHPQASASQQSRSQGSRSLGGSVGTPTSQLRPGSEGDCTAQYWSLMSSIQRDIVPILEKLKTMVSSSQRLGGDSEKVASKLAEIISLLPRLKIQRNDPKYSNRLWTKREYEQLEKIERQLGPYCKRFAPAEAKTAAGTRPGAGAPQAPAAGTHPAPQAHAGPAVRQGPLQPRIDPRPPVQAESVAPPSHAPETVANTATDTRPVPGLPPTGQAQPALTSELATPTPAAAEEAKGETPAAATPVEHPSASLTSEVGPGQALGSAEISVLGADTSLLASAEAYRKTASATGRYALQRLLASQCVDGVPRPPSYLLPTSTSAKPRQVASSRCCSAVSENFAAPPASAVASSRAEVESTPSRKRVCEEAADGPDAARWKGMLEAECRQIGVALGSAALVSLSSARDASGCLRAEVRPSRQATAKQPGPTVRWTTLTARLAPEYPEAAPVLLLDCSPASDALSLEAEAVRDHFETSLAATAAFPRLEEAARAWNHALLFVHEKLN